MSAAHRGWSWDRPQLFANRVVSVKFPDAARLTLGAALHTPFAGGRLSSPAKCAAFFRSAFTIRTIEATAGMTLLGDALGPAAVVHYRRDAAFPARVPPPSPHVAATLSPQ